MRPGQAPADPPREPAKPQETAPAGRQPLWPTVDMDSLAAAYATALEIFADAGKRPDPLALVKVQCLVYDQLINPQKK